MTLHRILEDIDASVELPTRYYSGEAKYGPPRLGSHFDGWSGSGDRPKSHYNVPDTEAVPVPENLRTDQIGPYLHKRAVTVIKRSRVLPDHATEQHRIQAAAAALDRTQNTYATTAPAQAATERNRVANAQGHAAVTPAQVERPQVMTRLQNLVAEQQAKKIAEQASAEKKPEAEAKRKLRLMAERDQREQQRTQTENLPAPGLGL